jgi:hypothetical protein
MGFRRCSETDADARHELAVPLVPLGDRDPRS